MRSRIALISPENTVNTRTRSALRATLKQEDAALEDRLPKVTPPATKPPVAKPRPPAVDKTSARPAQAPTKVAAQKVSPSAPGKAPAAAPARPEERKAVTFKLATSDRQRLDTLRAALAAAGRRPRKSELVRAALAALGALPTPEVMALVDALPPVVRADDKKTRPPKDKKSAARRKDKKTGKSRSARSKG